jgi:colanic acid/amylovoran biosynthesis glycosyltransferase
MPFCLAKLFSVFGSSHQRMQAYPKRNATAESTNQHMPITRQIKPAQAAVAYLSNSFPATVEPYVGGEIKELQRRGMRIAPCSVWRSNSSASPDDSIGCAVLTVFTWKPWLLLSALSFCIADSAKLKDLLGRLLWTGNESWGQRARGVAHTVLGARLALELKHKNVQHLHVHHGYMAAWIGMVAARLLDIPYSLTLHGSDLLLRPTFLDVKLQNCAVCFTVSEYSRRYLLRQYPQVNPCHVLVQRMGVPVPLSRHAEWPRRGVDRPFTLLTVGRLHAVKDQAFLVRACAVLKASGGNILCQIAGDGPERERLQELIRRLHLSEEVQLLGYVSRNRLGALYQEADLVVLTSRSEGIPLTLMEAMALGRPVLAPAITGIPELIADGKTGFLYRPGSITDLVDRVDQIRRTNSTLGPICEAAREHVHNFFNLDTNLRQFSDVFLKQILGAQEGVNADSLLQQVQL